MYLYFSIMLKEKLNATQPTQKVLCAAVQYLDDALHLPNFRTLDQDVYDLLEVLLLTDFLEEEKLKDQLYQMISHAKFFTKAFEEFTDQEIQTAIKELKSHE